MKNGINVGIKGRNHRESKLKRLRNSDFILLNKKADRNISMITIGLAILIVGAILVILFTWDFFSGDKGLTNSMKEGVCSMGSSARNIMKLGLFPDLCTLTIVNINSADLGECSFLKEKLDEEKIKPDSSNQDYIYSICASEQMFDLARRCWNMRGAGAKDAGNLDCFRATIKAPSDVDIRISISDFKNLENLLKYKDKNFSQVMGRVDLSDYWATHGGILSGTDWEPYANCIEKEETWGIYYNDKGPIDQGFGVRDELWVGCTDNCNDNCTIVGQEKSLTEWWNNHLSSQVRASEN